MKIRFIPTAANLGKKIFNRVISGTKLSSYGSALKEQCLELIFDLRCKATRPSTKKVLKEENKRAKVILEELIKLVSLSKNMLPTLTPTQMSLYDYAQSNPKGAGIEIGMEHSRVQEQPFIEGICKSQTSPTERNILETELLGKLTRLVNGLGFYEIKELSQQRKNFPARTTLISIPTIERFKSEANAIPGSLSFFMEEFPSRFFTNNRWYEKLAYLELCNENRKSFSEMHFMPAFATLKDKILEEARKNSLNEAQVQKQLKEINNDIKLYCLTSLLKLIFLMKNNLINNKSHIFYVHTYKSMAGFLTKLGFQKNSKLPENLDESIYSVQISRTELLDSEDKFKKLALEYLKRHYANTPI